MPRPFVPECRPVMLATLLGTLLTAHAAQAHGLKASYHVLAGQKVQIEAWFGPAEPAEGLLVRVERDGRKLLLDPAGKTNREGIYVFAFKQAEPLKVVVSDGRGHTKILDISEAELQKEGSRGGDGRTEQAEGGGTSSEGTQRTDRGGGSVIKDLLLGVTFVLALAAFVIVLWNMQQLRELKQKVEQLSSTAAAPPVKEAHGMPSAGVNSPSAETPRPAAPPTGPGRR